MKKITEKIKMLHVPLTKKMIVLFTIAMVFCIVIFVMAFFVLNSNFYTFESGGGMFLQGVETQIPADSKMTKTVFGKTKISSPTGEISQVSAFAYLNYKEGIVTTEEMIYYNPEDGTFCRVECFSEIYLQGEKFFVKRGGKTAELGSGGFLYDGKDTYLYLEDATFATAGYVYNITHFSHVEAKYQSSVVLFEYASKAVVLFEDIVEYCNVETADGTTVEMFFDTITNAEGEKAMTVSNFALIPSVFSK